MKNHLKKIIRHCMVCLLIIICNTVIAQDYYGTWKGNAIQSGENTITWSVVMHLGKQTSTIEFPSLGCGGTLSYLGKNGVSFIFSENLTYGGGTEEGDCMLGLSVRFSLINSTTMLWKEIDSKGTAVASGTLTRDASGFTGTKTYNLTAKSWINKQSISEFSFDAFMLKKVDWSSNTPPTSPRLNPSINDYKLYQSFDVKVKFINGKVVSAKFNKESLKCRDGKSMSIKGLAYVIEQKTSDLGKESVTFTRTVAAHSKVLWLKEVFTGESPDIYNTISIDVFPDKIITHGYASDFPTTYFWIGDKMFAKKLQVQPSDYFKSK